MARIAAVVSLLSLAVLGCEKDKGQPAHTPGPNPSDFAERLTKVAGALTDASPPSGTVSLEWAFDPAKPIEYSYEHEMVVDTDKEPSHMKATGTLVLASKDGLVADATVEVSMTMTIDGESKTMKAPPVTISGIDRAGNAPPTTDMQDSLLHLLLPLPGKPIKPGETVTKKFTMPVRGSKTSNAVDGQSSVRLVRYVKCGTATCAQLATTISLPEKKFDLETGATTFSMESRGVALYNTERRALEEVHQTAVLKMTSKGEINMTMKQDHYIHVVRK